MTTEETPVETPTVDYGATDFDDLCAALTTFESTNSVPWANEKFKTDVAPPLIILHAGELDAQYSDNVNWPGETTYTIYLVTEDRDYTLEGGIKTMLENLELAYSFWVDTVDTEDVVQACFQFTVED